MKTFTVYKKNDLTKDVRVRASSLREAAIKGAVKLGLRWHNRKPATALPYRDGPCRLFHIYGPSDPKSGNAQHHLADVMVEEV